MKRSSMFFLSVGLMTIWYGMAQFTERRTKKGPSMAALKEQYCQGCADILKQIPNLLHKIATLQEKSVATISEYWEGDKTSFCNNASREKLTAAVAQIATLQEKISSLCSEIDSCVARL